MDTHPTNNYTTLEEIQVRKEQLSEAMMNDSEKIAALWNSVFKKQENSTRGEYIASIVTHSITAIDAFLLVRKLMKNYSNVLSFFRKPKRGKK
jgi:hypothetical protein